MKRLFGLSLISSLPLIVVGVAGCGPNSVEEEVVARVPSPDQQIDCVVVRYNPGAMSSYQYVIYLTPRKEQPSLDGAILDGDDFGYMGRADPLVEWATDRTVIVRIDTGTVNNFIEVVTIDGLVVRTKLVREAKGTASRGD